MGDDVLRTTISVGVAAYPTDYPGTIQGFLEKADQALYLAKATGRDRVISTAVRPDPAPDSLRAGPKTRTGS